VTINPRDNSSFHRQLTQEHSSKVPAEGPRSLPGDDGLVVVLLGLLWLHPGGKSLTILTKHSGKEPSLPLSRPTSHSSLSRLSSSTWSPSARSSSPGFSAVKENVASQYGPLEHTSNRHERQVYFPLSHSLIPALPDSGGGRWGLCLLSCRFLWLFSCRFFIGILRQLLLQTPVCSQNL